jgi:hypothetical protein
MVLNLLSFEIIRHVTAKLRYQLWIQQLLCTGRSRDIRTLLRLCRTFIGIVAFTYVNGTNEQSSLGAWITYLSSGTSGIAH